MIDIQTPDKYLYVVDKVKISQRHHESKHSYQTFIDDLLVFKKKNEDVTHREMIVYAKGVLAGRGSKKSVMEARKELKR